MPVNKVYIFYIHKELYLLLIYKCLCYEGDIMRVYKYVELRSTLLIDVEYGLFVDFC